MQVARRVRPDSLVLACVAALVLSGCGASASAVSKARPSSGAVSSAWSGPAGSPGPTGPTGPTGPAGPTGPTPRARAAAPTTAATTPSARPTGVEKQVGPLFAAGTRQPHGCSASVLHSPAHDLVITAAHCIRGTGAGELFAPDYRDGVSPFGTWLVLHAWDSAGWAAGTDPRLDVAVLQVAGRRIGGHVEQIEDVVGGETLGTTPAAGRAVSVIGYTAGIDDRQITCTNVLGRSRGFPAFSCHGYVGGTSGSPFLINRTPRVIVGLVGGRDQGGCTEGVSYSPPFGAAVAALYARAVADDPPDSLPNPPDDC